MDLNSLSDTSSDWLTSANKLLTAGVQTYQTVTGATKPVQTAQQVAAGSAAAAPFNWKPFAIGGAILAAVVGLFVVLSRK